MLGLLSRRVFFRVAPDFPSPLFLWKNASARASKGLASTSALAILSCFFSRDGSTSPALIAVGIDDEQQAATVSTPGWLVAWFERANPGATEWHVMDGAGRETRQNQQKTPLSRGSWIFRDVPEQRIGAQKRTRTSTPLPVPAPEAGASTNSAIWACGRFRGCAWLCQRLNAQPPHLSRFCFSLRTDSCSSGDSRPSAGGRRAGAGARWRACAARQSVRAPKCRAARLFKHRCAD
jgi:hypothetical protein